MSLPRIEIVKSRARKLYTPGATMGQLQYHVRVIAPNNRILVWSEPYTRRRNALVCAHHLLSLPDIIRDVDETGD
jgi:hypothetical protein